MRDILFRGKRIDNGEWVYGDLIQSPAHCVVQIVEQDLCGDYFAVHPSTVGQYTGLTDKNGKKIFESDIIYANLDGAIGVVCFGKNASPCENPLTCNLGYYVDWQGDDKIFLRNDIGYWVNRSDVEVIGNIHDNRVLLEDKT